MGLGWFARRSNAAPGQESPPKKARLSSDCTASVVRLWLAGYDPAWLRGIEVLKNLKLAALFASSPTLAAENALTLCWSESFSLSLPACT